MGILSDKITPNQPSQYSKIEGCLADVGQYLSKIAKNIGLNEINVLVLGGAALHLTGFRDTFSDVDVVVKEKQLMTAIPTNIIRSNDMDVEIGFDLKLGALDDTKAFSHEGNKYAKEINGINVSFSIYPEPYFVLLKMEHGREKCQDDIRNMLIGIDHNEVIAAFNNLATDNEPWVMDDIADMLMTDYAMLSHFGSIRGDDLQVLKDVSANLNVSDEKKKSMNRIFLSMKHSRKPKNSSGKDFCQDALTI